MNPYKHGPPDVKKLKLDYQIIFISNDNSQKEDKK